jgi:hypothetical protein
VEELQAMCKYHNITKFSNKEAPQMAVKKTSYSAASILYTYIAAVSGESHAVLQWGGSRLIHKEPEGSIRRVA